jgi:4'-phosphopantetheinyl transferase
VPTSDPEDIGDMVTRHESSLGSAAHQFLTEGELHVWQAQLDTIEHEQLALGRLLSPDERERAARFLFERDRRRYVAGRGILRSILGRYQRRPPDEISFVYGLRAKPFLPETALQFNMAHSDGLAVIAVGCSGAVGIDVERVRPLQDYDRLMNFCFSASEVDTILALPPADRLLAFFTCWTRKEAYLKARGDGIAAQLDRFSVSTVPGSQARLLHVQGCPHEVTRWSFCDLALGAGFLGVVVLEGAVRTVQHYVWNGPRGG